MNYLLLYYSHFVEENTLVTKAEALIELRVKLLAAAKKQTVEPANPDITQDPTDQTQAVPVQVNPELPRRVIRSPEEAGFVMRVTPAPPETRLPPIHGLPFMVLAVFGLYSIYSSRK